MYDLIIRGGRVCDGTGSPWRYADIAVKDNKISVLLPQNGAEAFRTIDATGYVVSPGFVDLHCHSDMLLAPGPADAFKGKLLSGVTTEVVGHCGTSLFPITPAHAEEYISYIKRFSGPDSVMPRQWLPNESKNDEWYKPFNQLERISEAEYLENQVSLVGHGTIRVAAMGMEPREATEEEIRKMEELLAQSLDAGGAGFSTGLIFPPCIFANREELRRLFKVSADRGKQVHVHMRSESDNLLAALEEVIHLAEETGARVEISHLRSIGKNNWGKARLALRKIEEARKNGLEIACDMYPYSAGNFSLKGLLPPWLHSTVYDDLFNSLANEKICGRIKNELQFGIDGWENLYGLAGPENVVVSVCNNAAFIGRNIMSIASELGSDPYEAVIQLLRTNPEIWVTLFLFGEEDVECVICNDISVICTDSLNSSHPRVAGTFPKILRKFVREKQVLPLERAIQKMTATAATRIGVQDRGFLLNGMKADIVVFDPEKVCDQASFQNPTDPPSGIEYVIVNGEVAVMNGTWTGKACGKVLRV